MMIHLLFTGIQTMFLRLHNTVAKVIFQLDPNLVGMEIYEETRNLTIGVFQKIIYRDWLPILLGDLAYEQYLGDKNAMTTYNSSVTPIVYNEVSTSAFRCHTLVRDLFSRCTPDGKRIDQLWLNDIMHKSKYAYDIQNNGLDSILCGSLYDYGFAHDANFAHQIHNSLFETTGAYGQTWRNDLIAINICRAREHGISNYNAYRTFCNISTAYYFEDFGNTINYDGIQLLKRLYKDVNDVDLFVGLNLEDAIHGGLVGPTSACLIGRQFRDLRDGDRFFFSHQGVLPPNSYAGLSNYTTFCFFCNTVQIDEVPANAFLPPNDGTNPLQSCTLCPQIDAAFLSQFFANGQFDRR